MKNGFTLIELLVVLVIISLVSAFVAPRITAPIGNLQLKTASKLSSKDMSSRDIMPVIMRRSAPPIKAAMPEVIMAPLMVTLDFDTEMQKALLVIAIGAGAMVVPHANDSGFWAALICELPCCKQPQHVAV